MRLSRIWIKVFTKIKILLGLRGILGKISGDFRVYFAEIILRISGGGSSMQSQKF